MQTVAAMLGLVLMLLSRACMATDLIGSIVPPFPEGWKDDGGACISKSLGTDKICDYSIGVLRAPKKLLLYIGKSSQRVDPKKARWIVTDQISFDQLPPGHHVAFALCERRGELDETILAVVKTTDTEWYTDLRSAYKANLNTGRFEKIPPKGIRCLNEGWGA